MLRSGDDDTLDIFVNMDNIHLRNEIARRRAMDPKLLGYWFKYGLAFLALGMLNEQRQRQQHRDDTETEETPDETGSDILARIEEACRGLAVTVIPVIYQLSRGREHALTGTPEAGSA